MSVLLTSVGIVTADELADTVGRDRGHPAPDGNIPWAPGGHTDPWNLVEAAMALDVGGRHARPSGRTSGSRRQQRRRAWHAYYVGDAVEGSDPRHERHLLPRRPARGTTTCPPATRRFLDDFWPVVERAIDYALDYQTETGEIAWRGDDPDDGALLTGSSSIHASLRCAIAIAERLGHERPDWELSLGSLAIAVAHRPDVFLDKAAGRWTGTTRSSVASCEATPPTLGWRRDGRRSWSKAAGRAASPTARGSRPPRRVSS